MASRAFVLPGGAAASSRAATQVGQWRVTGTDEFVDVKVPDNVIVAGRLQMGAVVSAHIATLPCAAPGFRLEIHGRDGALRVTTAGAPQRDINVLAGARGRAAFEPLEVPLHYHDVPPDTPSGPPTNVASLYRRLANGIRARTSIEPGFDDALRRHHLIDAIRRSSQAQAAVTLA